MGAGFPIFRQVQDNYRFGGEQHTDPASDHKNSNPATLAPCPLWLSTVSQSGWPHQEDESLLRIEKHKQEQDKMQLDNLQMYD
jgi:hypothetical protein